MQHNHKQNSYQNKIVWGIRGLAVGAVLIGCWKTYQLSLLIGRMAWLFDLFTLAFLAAFAGFAILMARFKPHAAILALFPAFLLLFILGGGQ